MDNEKNTGRNAEAIRAGTDLYADLRTAVAAFGNDDPAALKSCFFVDMSAGQMLGTQKGGWKISKGGYDKLWELSIDKNGTGYIPCIEANKSDGYDAVRIVNHQAVRDAGLNPFKALAVVKETWGNPRALSDEIVDFMAENTFAKFVHDNMPEIDYEVKPHFGGTIVKETGTGRDILLQPGDESDGFAERYGNGLVGEDEMKVLFPDDVPLDDQPDQPSQLA